MDKYYCDYFTRCFKHIEYFLLPVIFFFGTCNTPNFFYRDDASKPWKIVEGKILYGSHCARCHDIGMAGAPKLGDKQDWSERIVDGEDVLVEKAIAGIVGKNGIMPPKGGNYSLADEEVKMIVLYMISTIERK